MKSSVSKEDCILAGLSVGGTVHQNGELVELTSSEMPSDCFLSEGDNIIQFNVNPAVNAVADNYVSVCREIEVRSHLFFFFF